MKKYKRQTSRLEKISDFFVASNFSKLNNYKQICKNATVQLACIAIFVFSTLISGQLYAKENPIATALFTDTPPIIDGLANDACWKSATKSTDFFNVISKGQKVTEQTEVYFSWDVDNLYVLWNVFESNPENVVWGSPESKSGRDKIDRREAVEVQIHPYRSDPSFWLLYISSPLGARCDFSSKSNIDFNSDWECATSTFSGGWRVEMKIPFVSFVHTGQYFGTPSPGDAFHIKLYRKKAKPFEVSKWSPVEQSQENYWNLKFLDPSRKIPEVSAKYSVNDRIASIELTVEGYEDAVQGQLLVENDKKAELHIDAKIAKPDEAARRLALARAAKVTDTLRFNYQLLKKGSYNLAVSLESGGRKFYSAKLYPELTPLNNLMPESCIFKNAISHALNLKSNHYQETSADAMALNDKYDYIQKSLASLSEADRQKQKKLITECESFSIDWKRFYFLLNNALLAAQEHIPPEQKLAIGNVSSLGKLYPYSVYKGSLTEPICISGAGNESESFQLAIIPLGNDLGDVKVLFSDLVSDTGEVIKSECFRWFRVDYVALDPPPGFARVAYTHLIEPDPLLEADPLHIKKNSLGVAWVDIEIPAGVAAGIYKGNVNVFDRNGHSAIRPLIFNAYGFDIPKKSSMQIDFWYQPSEWSRFYKRFKYSLDVHERNAAILSRYRMSSFVDDGLAWSWIKIYREKDGSFSFDFSEFNKYMEISIRNNSTCFWMSLSCNSGLTLYLNAPNTKIIDRETGRTVRLAEIMQPIWEKFKEDGKNLKWNWGLDSIFENPVYSSFLVAYVENMKKLGINDCSWYELFDEVGQITREKGPESGGWNSMIRHHQFFRKVVPEMNLMYYGAKPTDNYNGKSVIGLVDSWAPHIFELEDQSLHEMILARKHKYGEKYWPYSCTQRRDANNNYTPYLYYHQSYIGMRIHSLMAWKWEWDAFYLFRLLSVPSVNCGKDASVRWPRSSWHDGSTMGEGYLIYPGRHLTVVPSMRLAALRDGLEDYEYFVILAALKKKLNPEKNMKLIEEIDDALTIESEIVSTVFEWTKDEALINAKRHKVANLINKINRIIEK